MLPVDRFFLATVVSSSLVKASTYPVNNYITQLCTQISGQKQWDACIVLTRTATSTVACRQQSQSNYHFNEIKYKWCMVHIMMQVEGIHYNTNSTIFKLYSFNLFAVNLNGRAASSQQACVGSTTGELRLVMELFTSAWPLQSSAKILSYLQWKSARCCVPNLALCWDSMAGGSKLAGMSVGLPLVLLVVRPTVLDLTFQEAPNFIPQHTNTPQIQLWCWHCAPYKCSYYYYLTFFNLPRPATATA